MKSKKVIYFMLMVLGLSTMIPTVGLATSVEDMKNKEEQAKQEGDALNNEINTVVESINEKYQELAKLQKEITKSKNVIAKTEKDIDETQDSIEKRSDLVASRMKEMQVREASQTTLEALLDAKSFSDFMNRAYAVTVLQSAEKTKVESLYADKERLDELESKLSETQQQLEDKQATALAEKEQLDVQVQGLKKKLADNSAALEKMTEERIAKEEQLRKEKEEQARKAAEAAAQAQKNAKATANAGNSSGGGSSAPVPFAPVPAPSSVTPPSGASNGQATAYVATGNNTATGSVPTPHRTIAVDPSVIPLGSLVQIVVPSAPQYTGVYRAEDTGGAVKGNIIDVFVGSQGEAIQFGRRAIIFSVL